jgi:hypothetical protein
MKLSQRLKDESAFVQAKLAGVVICERCHATLDDYAETCTADLGDPCPGFARIEEAKSEFNQRVLPYSAATGAQFGQGFKP